MALAALEQAGIPWRIACTSGSLSGLVAAAQAGLGIMAHSSKLMPKGLTECPPGQRLPRLGESEFVLLRARRRASAQIAELSAAIIAKAERF